MDPPFTKLDILSCRNLLIYFSADLQKKILPLFHYSLNPKGILFLGSAESIGGNNNLFHPLDTKFRVFIRTDIINQNSNFELISPFYPVVRKISEQKIIQSAEMNIEASAHTVLLQQYSPPAVLVNENGDIIFVNGKTGKYLEMPSGKANMNIYAMARDGLQYEISKALAKVIREGGKFVIHDIKIKNNFDEYRIDLAVEAMGNNTALKGLFLIVFIDIPTPPTTKKPKKSVCTDTEAMEKENQHLREEISTIREEMQTSQEELRSTNEELQSTNEELQSTNEELTTSKEEMQSLNEELQTVNAELQSRVEDLSRANNDMKNLLNSTDIATVFLDNDLKVRRFTTRATSIIRLIGSDIGRPLTDLSSNLQYPGLIEDTNEVLRTLAFIEKVIQTDDERWFTVRIMPYRTLDNRIDGLVITFIDVTAAKMTEDRLMGDQ